MDHYTIVASYGLDAQCKMRLPLLTEKMEKKYGGMDLFHGHPALIVSLRLQHIFAKFDDRPLFWKLISDHTLLKDLKYLSAGDLEIFLYLKSLYNLQHFCKKYQNYWIFIEGNDRNIPYLQEETPALLSDCPAHFYGFHTIKDFKQWLSRGKSGGIEVCGAFGVTQ